MVNLSVEKNLIIDKQNNKNSLIAKKLKTIYIFQLLFPLFLVISKLLLLSLILNFHFINFKNFS